MTELNVSGETLKPCPFCGNRKAGVVSYSKLGKQTVAWAIWCNAPYEKGGECAANGPPMPSEAEARTAWNTRTSSEETVRALVEALERIAGADLASGSTPHILANARNIARNALSLALGKQKEDGNGQG